LIPKKVAEGLYKLRNSFGSNIYVADGGGIILVDSGFPIDLPTIYLGLRALGAQPRDIGLAVATHYHGDHVGTMARLRRSFGVRVAMHEEDAPYASADKPQDLVEVAAWRLLFYTALWPMFRYRHFEVDHALREGDIVDLPGGFTVLHTPGHSAGSICLYSEERGILFSGDLVRNEGGVLEGPPEEFTPDTAAACRSLRRVAELDFDVLLPGHGDVITKGAGDLLRARMDKGMIWPL
jgi:glyoxylase-like metal-dependent hydrolase (beta-lactamase superfamily II)